MDKLYRAKLNSNIDLDFTKLLGFADVVVNFESSFYEFEQKKQEEAVERSRQEQEREKREKEEKMKREKEKQQKLKKPEDYDLPGGVSIPNAITLDNKKIVNLTFGKSLIKIKVWNEDKKKHELKIQQPETYVSADRLVDPRLIPAITQVFNIASKTVDFSTIHISATTNGHDESDLSNHKVERGARAIDISRIDGEFVEKLGPVHPSVINFQKAIDELPNIWENFGPYWLHKERVVYSPKPLSKKQKLQEDHNNHIHFSIKE
jgi:hypothetical protein